MKLDFGCLPRAEATMRVMMSILRMRNRVHDGEEKLKKHRVISDHDADHDADHEDESNDDA
eukprot:3749225-Rhodomonas_salina.1